MTNIPVNEHYPLKKAMRFLKCRPFDLIGILKIQW